MSNMKIENQVVSLELAKKLKELGVKQESFARWEVYDDINNGRKVKHIVFAGGHTYGDIYSAFTVAELGEMLPKELFKIETRMGNHSYLLDTRQNYGEGWYIRYLNSTTKESLPVGLPKGAPFVEANTEADARAKMLIYLLENNLITL